MNIRKQPGIVIEHGTDTLAYSSFIAALELKSESALEFPIIFTASLNPPDVAGSDAMSNRKKAEALAGHQDTPADVFVEIGGRIYLPAQIEKVRTASSSEDEPYFDKAWSVCHYDGLLKNLIHDFKYKKVTSLSTDFTALFIDFMKKYNIGKDSQIILSIPMHPNRLFQREINHADILAKALGKNLGILYSGNTLRKIKNTSLQSKLKRDARVKNLRSSFSIKVSLVVFCLTSSES